VNFALYSENATRVEVCLFDADGRRPACRCASRPPSSGTATCPACSPGSATATACTALRAGRGLRFNPNVVLLDPYAKALTAWRTSSAACSPTSWARARGPRRCSRTQRGVPLGVVSTRLRLGRRPRAQHAAARDRDLRGARARA
jgi:glycogen operon protein